MTVREILKALRKDGWYITNQEGSHISREVHGWSGNFLIVTFHTVHMKACGFCCHARSFFQMPFCFLSSAPQNMRIIYAQTH